MTKPDRRHDVKSTRAFRTQPTESNQYLPRCVGYNGAVASHHSLSALAAHDILRDGGNAVDAGVGAVLVEGVVNPHMHGPAGECPILIAAPGKAPISINGNTLSPRLATVDTYRARGYADMPDAGILAAGVPASLGALITALKSHGTRPFHEIVQPAIQAASNGFAMHTGLYGQEKMGIAVLQEKFLSDWTASATIYCRDGHPISVGDRVLNLALASVYETLARASQGSASLTDGYDAVWHEFYRGSVADAIDRYSQSQDGLLRRRDFEDFTVPIETPLHVDLPEFGCSVFKCDSWCQGPAFLQTLNMMREHGLDAYAHNSADYLHLLTEATNLAYADREQFYADPAKIDVPMAELLSGRYTSTRADLIDMTSSSRNMRPGDPLNNRALLDPSMHVGGADWGHGTVHVDVVDRHGLMAAFTPSGGWLASNEVIAELGFPLGNRAMTFYLEPDHHPNVLAPCKRPRTTISPSIATRGDQPWIAFGTMGGDQQDQWQLQFFLNVAVFGMTLQEAIEAPKCSSEHFDGFFAPHTRFPGRLRVESAVNDAVLDDLSQRGHEIDAAPMWTEGYMNAVSFDPDSGRLEAATDPRGAKGDVFPATAIAW